eukprot:TRINITY_DN41513_c0_g1_i1.p1 TRINITY_DN41513_c0_g1~~TRINITY_DN41513_c0_g1_i1.p1  ORF type:complete len:521 (-),score=109.23 TRINITY_DN41513_c0_g1_i1:147-1709(-)
MTSREALLLTDGELRDTVFFLAAGGCSALPDRLNETPCSQDGPQLAEFTNLIQKLEDPDTVDHDDLERARYHLDPHRKTPEYVGGRPSGRPNNWSIDKVGYWTFFFGHTPEPVDHEKEGVKDLLQRLKVKRARLERNIRHEKNSDVGLDLEECSVKFWNVLTTTRNDLVEAKVRTKEALFEYVYDTNDIAADAAMAFGNLLFYVEGSAAAVESTYPWLLSDPDPYVVSRQGIARWEFLDMKDQTEQSPALQYALGNGQALHVAYSLVDTQLELIRAPNISREKKIVALDLLKELFCLPNAVVSHAVLKFLYRGICSTLAELKYEQQTREWLKGHQAMFAPVVQMLLHVLRRCIEETRAVIRRIDMIDDDEVLDSGVREDVIDLRKFANHGIKLAFQKLLSLAKSPKWHMRQTVGVQMVCLLDRYGIEAGDVVLELFFDENMQVASATEGAIEETIVHSLKDTQVLYEMSRAVRTDFSTKDTTHRWEAALSRALHGRAEALSAREYGGLKSRTGKSKIQMR